MPTGSADARRVQDTSTRQDWKQWEGQVVEGKFRLERFLGGSERSAVFLTTAAEVSGQPAAIKLLAVDAGEAQLARWRQAASWSHPRLIRLYQMGRCQLGGQALLYLLMEYAPENLAQILPERPLTPAEVREMLPPILDALAFLHGKGLVHGHIKPANIMAIGDELRISSDGIGAAGEAAAAAPADAYDPPEAANAPKSPAADVWSLGVTVVEALTQQKPARDPRLPGALAVPKSLPAPFREIARQCLVLDPRRRCTLADIALQLQTSPAGPPSARATPPKAAAWRRYFVPVLVGLAVVAVVVGTLFLRQPPETRMPAGRETGGIQAPAQRRGTASRAAVPAKPANKQPGMARSAAQASSANAVGGVVRQVLPDVPQRARDTIQGTVRVTVRVQVDAEGDVTGAEFDRPGPSRYFARLAMEAARAWKFEPQTVNGQKVASAWLLRFEFRRTGTRVVPVRASR